MDAYMRNISIQNRVIMKSVILDYGQKDNWDEEFVGFLFIVVLTN